MPLPDIYHRATIDVLSPELKGLIKQYYTLEQFKMTGCTREDGFAGQGVIPDCPMERHPVFTTSTELGTYNHHSALTKWRGKYWYGWMNCMLNECWPGQRVFVAHSDDARTWSDRILLADGDEKEGIVQVLCALFGHGEKLYAIIQTSWDLVHASAPTMSAHDDSKISYRNDLWVSRDGVAWEMLIETYIDGYRTTENPRLTAQGRLLGPVTTHAHTPGAILWPGDDPEERPEIVEFPYAGNMESYGEGHDEGLFLYGEASWYTDDDGRIWMYWRDESGPACLGVTISEDHGKSWSEVMRSNFPDSMSRIYAGKLSDGRFYLVGNSTRQYMDRNFLALSLSDDGAKFDKMLRLVAEPTRQRFPGHLKCHGYQYPSCTQDGDRLLIAYSINKEDMEIGIVDAREV